MLVYWAHAGIYYYDSSIFLIESLDRLATPSKPYASLESGLTRLHCQTTFSVGNVFRHHIKRRFYYDCARSNTVRYYSQTAQIFIKIATIQENFNYSPYSMHRFSFLQSFDTTK